MTFLLCAFLLFQAGTRKDVLELRQYLGQSYRMAIQLLQSKNQILLRNTEPLAPSQAAEMRARMEAPPKLPADRPVFPLKLDNVGQGLLSFLFEDDFITEQVNFVFCPAQPDRPERLLALQVLLDDSQALKPAAELLQSVYELPRPLPLGSDYKPALQYPLAVNLPLTIWNLGPIEAVYQPIAGQRLITGQFWLTDKAAVTACTAVPKLRF